MLCWVVIYIREKVEWNGEERKERKETKEDAFCSVGGGVGWIILLFFSKDINTDLYTSCDHTLFNLEGVS